MSISLNELPEASFRKRHFARHYSYFDYAEVTTLTAYTTELIALGAALSDIAAGALTGNALYIFGTNARGKQNPASTPANQPYGTVNWPTGTYAREVLLRCSQDVRVQFISINPEYLKEYVLQNATGGQLRTSSSQLIYEKEFFIPAEDYIRMFPTYGYAMVFRADSISGTLYAWIEGSVEGDES